MTKKQFVLKSQSYSYLIHPYNHTWVNERAVEIPVVLDFLKSFQGAQVLEVGNVLSHYYDFSHLIVDKHEIGIYTDVINEDILVYNPNCKFDAIISISTIEHVGWDEKPKMPERVLDVFPKMFSLLQSKGKAILTIPVGYNTFLDQCLREVRLPVSEVLCLRKISIGNEWEEVDVRSALSCRYGHPFQNANAVIFLFLEKQ